MKLTYRALATILALIALIFTIFPDLLNPTISNWIVAVILALLILIIVFIGKNQKLKERKYKIKKSR